MTTYIPFVEKNFGMNDIFVLFLICLFLFLIVIFPKRIPKGSSTLLFLFSVVVASVFDNSIGADNFDYYDILDGPKYTIMDVVAYLLYLPFGYFFYYMYDKYKIRGIKTVAYILAWTLFGMLFEYICISFNLFTYKNGYKYLYSVPIYLFSLTVLLLFVNTIIMEKER
ncbi:hypothetical protein ACFSCX_23475 [Bacillus salitolerans]|uniref:Uncharacterized protein n=1 Tax=Bacillus salitolerans TaxID=1437434 RepID=A0ABW4LX24_9BACI